LQGRQDAIQLLVDTDNAAQIDYVGHNIMNLKEREKCKEKLEVIKELRRLGDSRALPAIEETLKGNFADKVRYLCLRKTAQTTIKEMGGASKTSTQEKSADSG
jgi:hypothetical protein